jgi:4-hydroxy-4-methyl-2-oxoglutarate aldolase
VTASQETHTSVRRGHHPVIRARQGAFPGTIDESLVASLRSAPLTDLSDAVGRLYTMSTRIRPFYEPMNRVIGTTITVKAVPGDNWAIHGALRLVEPGTVLVVDWRATTQACGAGVSALLPAIRRGLSGLIIDGAWRDVAEVAAIDFPIMATGVSPYSPAKNELGEINVPVSCGDVVVQPGDLVVGDSEGIVVLPRDDVPLIAEHVQGHHLLTSRDDITHDDNQEDVRRLGDEYWRQFDAEGGTRP